MRKSSIFFPGGSGVESILGVKVQTKNPIFMRKSSIFFPGGSGVESIEGVKKALFWRFFGLCKIELFSFT